VFFHLPQFSLVFAYIYISQSSVETHLLCGGIYHNHIIANCLQSVPVKEFWKLVNSRQRIDESEVPSFLWPNFYVLCSVWLCDGQGV